MAMNRGVLFLISTDPRESPRAAEAVRIAAGIGAWRKVAVTIYLGDNAVLALGEHPDDLMDGDHFRRYLPLIAESGGLICAQRGAPLLGRIGQAPVDFREIGRDELAAMAAKNDYLLRM
jgi:hypothetical protein